MFRNFRMKLAFILTNVRKSFIECISSSTNRFQHFNDKHNRIGFHYDFYATHSGKTVLTLIVDCDFCFKNKHPLLCHSIAMFFPKGKIYQNSTQRSSALYPYLGTGTLQESSLELSLKTKFRDRKPSNKTSWLIEINNHAPQHLNPLR